MKLPGSSLNKRTVSVKSLQTLYFFKVITSEFYFNSPALPFEKPGTSRAFNESGTACKICLFIVIFL